MPEDVTFSKNINLLTASEIDRISKFFVEKFGVNKIRLTGGEPLIRKDFSTILKNYTQKIFSNVDFGITTNGLLIDRYIDQLISQNFRINLSMDSLVPTKFAFIARQPLMSVNKVLKNFNSLLLPQADSIKLKLNVVVMRNFNEDEIIDFIELTRENRLEVRFLEYMPFEGNKWSRLKVATLKDIENTMDAHYGEKIRRLPPESIHDVTKLYKHEDFKGSIGLISTITSPFCGGCNRIRLTADGCMKNCLFSENELDLRKLLRDNCSDDEMESAIRDHMKTKKFSRDLDRLSSRPMIHIGG